MGNECSNEYDKVANILIIIKVDLNNVKVDFNWVSVEYFINNLLKKAKMRIYQDVFTD